MYSCAQQNFDEIIDPERCHKRTCSRYVNLHSFNLCIYEYTHTHFINIHSPSFRTLWLSTSIPTTSCTLVTMSHHTKTCAAPWVTAATYTTSTHTCAIVFTRSVPTMFGRWLVRRWTVSTITFFRWAWSVAATWTLLVAFVWWSFLWASFFLLSSWWCFLWAAVWFIWFFHSQIAVAARLFDGAWSFISCDWWKWWVGAFWRVVLFRSRTRASFFSNGWQAARSFTCRSWFHSRRSF